jgi:hypothetical protein
MADNKNNFSLYFCMSLLMVYTIIFLAFFISFLPNGLDLTDEGSILNLILYPWEYDAIAFQFGFLYHFLSNALGNNIYYLRLIIASTIFISNFVLILFILKLFFKNNIYNNKYITIMLSFILSAVSLGVYVLWLPTPNYNLLNYNALAITLIGICLVQLAQNSSQNRLARSWPGWVLIGVGGWLVFMAKPQSAAGLAVLVTLWAWLSGSFRLKGFVLAAGLAFGLLLLAGLSLDGSVAAFVARYRLALRVESLSGSHHVLKPLTLRAADLAELFSWRLAACLALLLAWGTCLGLYTNRKRKRAWFGLISASGVLFAFYMAMFFSPIAYGYTKALFIAILPLGLLLADLIEKSPRPANPRPAWAVMICALALVFSLGTNNFLFVPLSLSSFFLLLGLAILTVADDPRAPFRMAGLALSGLMVVSVLMWSAWAVPYRQPAPLWEADVPVPIPFGGPALRFSKPQARFFSQLYEIIDERFEPGTPVIDLTGRLPGVIFAMGGLLPKTHWLSSSGHHRAAVFALNRLTCQELARAWVIVDESPIPLQLDSSPFHLDHAILSAAGLDHQNHYQLAGRAELPILSEERGLLINDLLFLKPFDDWAVRARACQARRSAG